MSKKIMFSVDVPKGAAVQIETKIVVLPAQESSGKIDIAALTDDDMQNICDAHFHSGNCPLAELCRRGLPAYPNPKPAQQRAFHDTVLSESELRGNRGDL